MKLSLVGVLGLLSFAACNKGRKVAMVKCTPTTFTRYVEATASGVGASMLFTRSSKGIGSCVEGSRVWTGGPPIPELAIRTSMWVV